MPTVRQAIKELLEEQAYSARDLSQFLSMTEKDVLEHLGHIARAPGPGRHFQIIPAACRHCGFTFKKRERPTRPSRCPHCRHTSISSPRFALVRER